MRVLDRGDVTLRSCRAVPVAVLATALTLVLGGCEGQRTGASPTEGVTPASPHTLAETIVHAAAGGDGDSWKDTLGREYRMGLINSPEQGQCFGEQATTRRKQLVADGFRAQSYATDRYGRLVSVITLPDGTNLNVWMARNGYADDRYLSDYRHEHPELATQLDTAFAAAKRARLGLWGACSSTRSG